MYVMYGCKRMELRATLCGQGLSCDQEGRSGLGQAPSSPHWEQWLWGDFCRVGLQQGHSLRDLWADMALPVPSTRAEAPGANMGCLD